VSACSPAHRATAASTLIESWPDDGARLRLELKELETQGDRITHDVMHHLNLRAATPFSVADAHVLASELDDVVDLAEEVADFMLALRRRHRPDGRDPLKGHPRAARGGDRCLPPRGEHALSLGMKYMPNLNAVELSPDIRGKAQREPSPPPQCS
jgi:hypothetical protein